MFSQSRTINTDPSVVFSSGGMISHMMSAIIVDLIGRTFEGEFSIVALTERRKSCGITVVRCFFAANIYMKIED
jgi:hypothetical protein